MADHMNVIHRGQVAQVFITCSINVHAQSDNGQDWQRLVLSAVGIASNNLLSYQPDLLNNDFKAALDLLVLLSISSGRSILHDAYDVCEKLVVNVLLKCWYCVK